VKRKPKKNNDEDEDDEYEDEQPGFYLVECYRAPLTVSKTATKTPVSRRRARGDDQFERDEVVDPHPQHIIVNTPPSIQTPSKGSTNHIPILICMKRIIINTPPIWNKHPLSRAF
jgi:hypothetical protein